MNRSQAGEWRPERETRFHLGSHSCFTMTQLLKGRFKGTDILQQAVRIKSNCD